MARKKFQELDLQDAFLFAAALSDEETFICTFDPFGKGLYRYSFEKE